MKATKCIKVPHNEADKIACVFAGYRWMFNEGMRLGAELNITSKRRLYEAIYGKLEQDIHSHYKSSCIFHAASTLKAWKTNLKKGHCNRPYLKKQVAKITNQGYVINGNILRIPTRPREYVYVTLNEYHLSKLAGRKTGEITITPEFIIIPYSEDKEITQSEKWVGIDVNYDNTTATYDDGTVKKFDTSPIRRARQIMTKTMSKVRRNDDRVRKKIASRAGKKCKNRQDAVLHKISKDITSTGHGIIREDLKGIRNLGRRGGGRSKKARRDLNTWPFFILFSMIGYKALWAGLPVIAVNPYDTSSTCSACGKKIAEEGKMVRCMCGLYVDRDENASKNILAKGQCSPRLGTQVKRCGSAPALRVDACQFLTSVSEQ